MAQFEAGAHPTPANLLQPLAAVGLSLAVGGGLIVVLTLIVRRTRRAMARNRKLHADATAERRARAMMDELCPHGWRAELALLGARDERPEQLQDHPDWVVLDWVEHGGGAAGAGRVRRVVAPTIAAALDAMVADRLTDETLRQIEQSALDDGARWPDS
jgi:hypothetical protein